MKMDKAGLISMLINLVLSMMTPEILKKFADMVLDFVEDTVANSTTKWDDVTILPMCNVIRSTFGIPDDDEIEKVVPEKTLDDEEDE